MLKDNEKANGLLENGDKLLERITSWEGKLIQPNQKTFQDVINFRNQLNAEFMHLKGFVDVAEPKVTDGAKERLRDLLAQWKTYEEEKNAIVGSGMQEIDGGAIKVGPADSKQVGHSAAGIWHPRQQHCC